MSVRVALLLPAVVTWIACGDPQARKEKRAAPLESAIERELATRFGTQVTTACTFAGAFPVRCIAKLADGTELPIAIENASKDEWGWRVDGTVVETAQIVAFVTDGLAAMHVPQAVDCGAKLQVIKPGERVVCKLASGGAAFVAIAPDGSTTLELALDPQAAAARTELVTADRDRELAEQSKALEPLSGATDGEEAVVADAGVP